MAEAATVLLASLAAFAGKETVAIYALRDEVNKLESELKAIKCFLKDADGQSGGNEQMKNRVINLRKVAHEIEDIIDTFAVKIGRYYHRKDLKGKAKRYAHMPKETIDRLKIRNRIKNIKKKLVEITRQKDALDIRRIDEGADGGRQKLLDGRRREACKEDEPKNVVGLEKQIDELEKLLVEGEERRCVISVVGQAGLGKTVLARKVYNRAKRSFSFSAWIHVSKHTKGNQVLRELCKAVSRQHSRHGITAMDEREMQQHLQKELEQNKYLVVLDDVWTRDVWDAVEGALPDGSMGNRVLITTRYASVAKHADPDTPPHSPPLLNLEDSRKLFDSNAFPSTACPHELESPATRIVGRCGGLPLALAVVGRLLSCKDQPTPQTPLAWDGFIEGLDGHLTEGDDKRISRILALSLDDLPDHLKPCLLYCSAFPRDSEIRVERLLRLWIAEGFIETQGNNRLEAVAMGYLHELVDRSLIQPCKWKPLRQIKSCRIHGALRATLVATAKEQNFFQIHSADSNNEPLEGRRLAIDHHLDPKTRLSLPLARAFVSFTESEPRHNFKLLKVLDLEGVRCFKTLPKQIGDLVLLRYLGLRHTSIETLPRSAKKLYNLQTLDLRTSATVRLSKSTVYPKNLKAKHIKKMTNLRHLYFGDRRGENLAAMEVPDDFAVHGAFKELRTLSYVKAGGWVEKGLPNMTSLSKLGIQFIEECPSALKAIAQLRNLRSLYLLGRLVNFTTDELQNLTDLTLDSTGLGEDSFSGLQTLTSLGSLKLFNNAYVGNTMKCSGRFPRLEVLNLGKLQHLKDVKVESFPRLRCMTIASCENLDKIPERCPSLEVLNLKNLAHLKKVDVRSQAFPQLRHLTFDSCENSGEIHQGFPNLEELNLENLKHLKDVTMGSKAFPRLRCMTIASCENLDKIPQGLENVSSLKELNLINMPVRLLERVHRDVGADWHIVKHIRKINMQYC